jgi:hypothetical protein
MVARGRLDDGVSGEVRWSMQQTLPERSGQIVT